MGDPGPEGELIIIKTIKGKIIEAPKSNEVYLALFDQGNGWCVSGVIYYKPDEVVKNLAAFVPKKVLIIKVEIPKEN